MIIYVSTIPYRDSPVLIPPAAKQGARYMGYFEMRRLFDRCRIFDLGLLWVKFTDIFYFVLENLVLWARSEFFGSA